MLLAGIMSANSVPTSIPSRSFDMAEASDDRQAAWIVDLTVRADVTVGDDRPPGRDAFVEWLWEALSEHGLAGVFEGAVDVEAAAAAGLIDTPLVLDAAEAPADRDWVAGMGRGEMVCWFADEVGARRAAAQLARVGGCEVRGVRREVSPGENEAWREAFSPVVVPRFGQILPAWEPGDAAVSASGVTIFIEPGAGFGTGLHETTQLCLAAIRAWHGLGGRMNRLLDFGAGSGVLGIAAAVLGAEHVDAVEVDVRVHAAIASNAVRNGVAHRVGVASQSPPDGEAYDVIIANIVAEVLIREADELCGRVRRDASGGVVGGVVLSGLLAADVEPVATAYAERLGLAPEMTTLGDWTCLTFAARPSGDGGRACR
jgi:ribosomal protein L11 methyltransferase